MTDFVRTLDPTILAAIQASPWCSADFETTALSPSSPPTRVGSSQKIGGEYTATAYQKHFGAGLDCRQRPRVWSVSCSDMQGGTQSWAFELDSLTREETATLLRASLDGKVVIGHNLGFDYGWRLPGFEVGEYHVVCINQGNSFGWAIDQQRAGLVNHQVLTGGGRTLMQFRWLLGRGCLGPP
jgi:hypothetical protein